MEKLIIPSTKYKNSYLKALSERKNEPLKGLLKTFSDKPDDFNYSFQKIKNNFDDFIKYLTKTQHHPPKNRVPQTVFWLIDNNQYIPMSQKGNVLHRTHLLLTTADQKLISSIRDRSLAVGDYIKWHEDATYV